MKMISGFLSMLMLVGLGGLFVLKSPSGESWLSAEDFTPDVSGAKTALQSKLSAGLHQTKQLTKPSSGTVYRWKDEQGVWQFSDTPPAGQTSVEQIEVQPDRNVIQGLAVYSAGEEQVETEPQAASFPLPTTIPMGDIPKLIEDARNIQKLLNNRHQIENAQQEE